jgi:hypothetical protein
MMIFGEILAIWRLSLEIANKLIDAMPPEERANFTRRHDDRMEALCGWARKFEDAPDRAKE